MTTNRFAPARRADLETPEPLPREATTFEPQVELTAQERENALWHVNNIRRKWFGKEPICPRSSLS